MANYTNFIKMLETASENNTDIIINYTSSTDNVNVSMKLIPDIILMGDWISIADKEDGVVTYFSFSLNSNIEFDEAEEEYIIPIGDGELIIAMR